MKLRLIISIVIVALFSHGVRAEGICAEGYSYVYQQDGRNFCFAIGDNNCSQNQYACGLNGQQCCPLQQDNPCSSGFESCKPSGNSQHYGDTKPMCCQIQVKQQPKPKEQPATKPIEPILSGVRVRCRSTIGTGSSDFFGRSAVSCQEAFSRATAEADKYICTLLGSNYSEFGREKIKTGTCP